jgi:hypothetical protein
MAYFNGRWTTFIFVDAGPKGNAAMLTQEKATRRTMRSSTLTVLLGRKKTTATSRSLSHSPLYGGAESFPHLLMWRKVHNLNGQIVSQHKRFSLRTKLAPKDPTPFTKTKIQPTVLYRGGGAAMKHF